MSPLPNVASARDVECVAVVGGTVASGLRDLTDKDRAENVIIVGLVRNDLGRVCVPGTVRVPALLAEEGHPGLVHLVSTVEGELRPGVGWAGTELEAARVLAVASPGPEVSG